MKKRLLMCVVLLVSVGFAWADGGASINLEGLEHIYTSRQAANIIWVERREPRSLDDVSEDYNAAEMLVDELSMAAVYVQLKFHDVPGKDVFILIDTEKNAGAAARIGQEAFDAACTLGETGWLIDTTTILEHSFFAAADDRQRENIREKLELMWSFSLSEDGQPLWGNDNPVWFMVRNFKNQATHAIEKLKPAPYVVATTTLGDTTIWGRYWWSELRRYYRLEETGPLVWVETNDILDVSEATAVQRIAGAAAYAHLMLGEELFEKTLCIFIKNKEERGYITLLDPKTLKESFSHYDSTWRIDYAKVGSHPSSTYATLDEIGEFKDIRETVFRDTEITQKKINRLEARVRSKYRGMWLTAATTGGFIFNGRQLGYGEATLMRDWLSYSLSAGYREVPYETEDLTFTSKELLIAAAFGFGVDLFRFDLVQLYFPVNLDLESETGGADLETALPEEQEWGGFSAGTGMYFLLGPLHLGMSLDYLAAIFTDMPLRFNIHAGLTAKTGFKFRGGF